jgi:CHASE2 domain-containing sensor protein
MIDPWGVFRNLLWIAGLAVGLATLSVAEYQANEEVRLRQKLAEPASQFLLSSAIALACLGLFLSGRFWWERAIFGLLALFFGAQTFRLRRHARRAGSPTRDMGP